VSVIRPADVAKTHFDQAWLFRYDGSLVRRIIDPANEKAWSEGGITQKDALLYPELTDIFSPLKHDVRETSVEYADLACGVKLMQYNEPARAETCLRAARCCYLQILTRISGWVFPLRIKKRPKHKLLTQPL